MPSCHSKEQPFILPGVLTVPGMGPAIGAERLAGLAPVPWGSGKVSGSLRR